MNKKILIITGGNRGLGKAIIDLALKDNDALIISLSRSLNEEHKNISIHKLIFIKTDLSESFSDKIFEPFYNYITPDVILYFFNNAGIILPIGKIGCFKTADIETSLKVNIEYPVNLVNFLLNRYTENKIILINISSGAANNPIGYWSIYGGSKAFMKMFFSVLKEENIENKNLTVYNIDPGTMDTGMQQQIRNNVFPKQDYFMSLKQEHMLIKPEEAAMKIFNEINYRS